MKKSLVQRGNPPAVPVVMYRRLCRTLGYGEVPEALACGVPVQLPHCMGAQVSLPGAYGRGEGECREGYPHAVRVARSRSDGAERPSGSCASGVFDPAEAVGVGVHGVSEGEVGHQAVQELSGTTQEAVLGESLLGTRILCEHGRYERRTHQALCEVPRRARTAGGEEPTGLSLLESPPIPPPLAVVV